VEAGHRWKVPYLDNPRVFDEGLHGGVKEPGYLEDVKKGCEEACKDFGQPTLSGYQRLHKVACAHFDEETANCSPLIKIKEAGKFNRGDYCREPLSILYTLTPEQMMGKIKFDTDGDVLQISNEARQDVQAKLDRINSHIENRSQALGLSEPIAILGNYSNLIYIHYRTENKKLEEIVRRLFQEYTEKMAAAKSSDEKIEYIADLYQVLEWLHPFPDGQGRTDLIFLAKELVAAGLNPPILEQPYFSSWAHLDDWVIYLKQGIERWQKEFSTLPPKP